MWQIRTKGMNTPAYMDIVNQCMKNLNIENWNEDEAKECYHIVEIICTPNESFKETVCSIPRNKQLKEMAQKAINNKLRSLTKDHQHITIYFEPMVCD